MTIPNTTRKAGPLLGTGSQTAWPFTFKVFATGDVQVTTANSSGVETLLVLGTDYTVTLNSNQDTSPGGTVNYPISGSALPVGSVLAIVGDLDYDQPLDLPSGGNFSPTALENQLDRSTMQIQQLREEMNRTAKLPPTSSESVEQLVDDLQRIADSADNLDTVANNIADIITVANDLNEPVSEINTVAGAIANVNAVGNNITNVNTVAGISANVTTVAGIQANVTTVAGIAANVTAVAGISGNVTTVAGISADVQTVADNVADITNFADVYQGAKTSDPTLRNDGSALQAGDLYFNTPNGEMRVYGGTQWKSGFVGTVAVQTLSGNGSTTAFTLSTAPGGENNTQVYIGGVYQQKDQYSVSGTTLTFSAAPIAGTNNIEVVTISTLALGETDASLVSFAQAGAGAVERTVQGKLREFVSVKDFGAVGDGVANDTVAIQAAVTYASNNSRSLYFPAGVYQISSPITFGGTAFAIWGEAASNTIIREVLGSGQIKLFDMTGLGGDTCVVENLSFYGPISGGFGGTGIHINETAGVDIRSCWFAGLLNGVNKTAATADFVVLNCTFESCYSALTLAGGAEAICDSNIFYLCNYDYNLTGDFIASNFSNSNHLATANACVYLNGVRFAQFTNISCAQEFQTNLPVIINMVNACSFNSFIGVQTKNFGSTLVEMASGAACTNNTFDNIVAARVAHPPGTIAPPAGTLGSAVVIGSGNSDNLFTNFNFYGCGYGVILAANNNKFDGGVINACATGALLQNGDYNEFVGVKFVNNSADWQVAGTVTTVWLDGCECSLTAMTATRYGSKGAGNNGRVFYATTDPASAGHTLAYLRGDRVINKTPSTLEPGSWVCVAAGSPGTWAQEGFVQAAGTTASVASGVATVVATGAANSIYRVTANGNLNTGSYVLAFVQFNSLGNANITTTASAVMSVSSPSAFQIAVSHTTSTQTIKYLVERVL